LPTIDTGTYHITVRHSPNHRNYLEFTATPYLGTPRAYEVTLEDGKRVVDRREVAAIQVPLNRNDAMILSSMLQEVAYHLELKETHEH
jgi:hypothetical protein